MNLQMLLFRFRWVHAPATILMLLLQRTPVLRVLTAQSPCFGLNAGDVLKSVFVLGAMGAYNSVAGATTFNALAVSPTTVTPASGGANSSFTASCAQSAAFKVTFTGTGAPSTIKSWKVSGTTFPPGLSVTGGTATTGGYWINGLSVPIAGTPTTAGSYPLTVTAYDSTGGTGGNSAKVTCTITITGGSVAPSFTTQPSSQTVTAGANVTFTAAASGTPTPTYQWYQGTTLLAGQTNATLSLTNVQTANAGNYSVIATNSVSSVSSNNATLTVNTAPVFTTQPSTQTVTAGTNVTFTAAASGTPTPTFQWYKNSVAISGQTAATLSLTAVQATDAGSYTVLAINSVSPSGVSSSAATLTVNTAPVFTTQPAATLTVNAGGTATFTAAASGIPAPTYQWYQGTTLLTGQTNATLSLTNVQTANAGTYSVKATNSVSTVSSNNATLTVNTAPVFTTQPSTQTITAGANVSFTAAASGTPTPTFQWYKNSVAISGQTSATLSLTGVQTTDAASYSVTATNSVSSVSSNNATLTVNTAPVFTTQPATQTVTAGTNVTFTAVASGTPTPTYQWYKNSVAISGQTSATLSLTAVQSTDAGSYTVLAINSVSPSGVSSTAATLTVNTAPVFTTQPATQTATVGATVTFTAAASGIPTPTYQWYQGTTLLTGQTGASLSLPNIQVASAGSYSVLAINSVSPGGISSNIATLTVNTALQSWRQLYFGTTANTGTAADSAVSNLDGLPNLMEYALGGTPTVANGAIAPKLGTTVSSGSTYLTLTFTPQRADITYAIEVSANLGSTWTSIPLAGLLTIGKSYTFTDTVAAAAGAPRFLRLRVTGQ